MHTHAHTHNHIRTRAHTLFTVQLSDDAVASVSRAIMGRLDIVDLVGRNTADEFAERVSASMQRPLYDAKQHREMLATQRLCFCGSGVMWNLYVWYTNGTRDYMGLLPHLTLVPEPTGGAQVQQGCGCLRCVLLIL